MYWGKFEGDSIRRFVTNDNKQTLQMTVYWMNIQSDTHHLMWKPQAPVSSASSLATLLPLCSCSSSRSGHRLSRLHWHWHHTAASSCVTPLLPVTLHTTLTPWCYTAFCSPVVVSTLVVKKLRQKLKMILSCPTRGWGGALHRFFVPAGVRWLVETRTGSGSSQAHTLAVWRENIDFANLRAADCLAHTQQPTPRR